MHAIRHLTPATLVVATLAAAVVVLQAQPALAAGAAVHQATPVVQLPTVHVVAPRSALRQPQVVVLPTVQVVAKRPPALLAQKAARAYAL